MIRNVVRIAVAMSMLFLGQQASAQSNPSISSIFQSALACALIEPLLSDGEPAPLYTLSGTNCVSVVPGSGASNGYYTDSACSTSINFEPTSLLSHCEVLLDASSLGEGAGLVEDAWTLSPGTKIDLGARSLDGLAQPYLQRRIYRTVETLGGSCDLEMRVYSPKPGVSAKGSLLALHGGSWSARGFGFFGLELTIPHFIDQGFVVYAPFYRLLGDSEGSAACHNASIVDITNDASAALEWVRNNAEQYGSTAKPVVFGQSAGAHLAASLSLNHPDDVVAGVLFYPPTDFTDFALRVRNGHYTNEQGLNILTKVIGVTAEEADLNATPVPENSFPSRIVEGALETPPLMMVHGLQDDLVEARQSIRLCDALAGRELMSVNTEVQPLAQLRESVACGANSTLQLIQEGQHALDVCIADTFIATDLCPSGSSASRLEVSEAIGDAVSFAVDAIESELPVAPTRRSGGAGSLGLLALLLSVGFLRVSMARRTVLLS